MANRIFRIYDAVANLESYDGLSANIGGATTLCPNEGGFYYANINCAQAGSQASISWEISTDGINFNYIGDGEYKYISMQNDPIQVRISASIQVGGISRIAESFLIILPECEYYFLINANTNEQNVVKSNLMTYPNPSKESFNVDFNFEKEAIVDIDLISLTGTRVFNNKRINIEKGKGSISINTTSIPTGIYYLVIKGKDIHINKKISIVH